MSVREGSPLVIRCYTGAPVAGPNPYVHLDALLAWAVVLLRGPRPIIGHTSSDPLERVSLPLRREGGMWACSCLWPAGVDDPVRAETRWRLRPALEYDFLIADRQVAVGHGPRRSHDEALTLWPYRVWEARAEGQASDLRKLLRQVTAIGKKRSQGYGQVVRWEIEHDDSGYRWRSWGGIARRPIPHPHGRPTGVDPPQWYRPWWRPAIEPGAPLLEAA